MTGIQRIAIALLQTFALAATPFGAAADEMSDVRSAYVELRRDLLRDAATTIAPSESQVAVFVTVDPESRATLEAVSLALNNQLVSHRRYGETQLRALVKGGADRLYVGDLASGSSTLSITFAGNTRKGKPYARSQSIDVAADGGSRYVQFELARTSTKGIPDVVATVATDGAPQP